MVLILFKFYLVKNSQKPFKCLLVSVYPYKINLEQAKTLHIEHILKVKTIIIYSFSNFWSLAFFKILETTQIVSNILKKPKDQTFEKE